ncbi:hypothetical protein PENSPDRAFT_638134 [Peniophora sp. CONT]|nr:hypothetical protein PENSPDRAFT_638134 [Peniophora sp. CONT]
MADDSAKLRKKLATLTSTLDELEKELAPLLAQSLPETTMNLDPIQQAKLQVLLPYLTYDLSFIYLKTRGVDPKTHPVIAELDRVKEYFGKIKNVEDPPQRPTQIDKAAAARFIKHGLTQPAYGAQSSDEAVPGPSSTPVVAAPKVTAKMLERAKWEKDVRERMDEEDDEVEDADGLEVFNEDAEAESSGVEIVAPSKKGKARVAEADSNLSSKRRKASDFFDESTPVATPSASEPGTPTGDPARKKKKKRNADSVLTSAAGTPTSESSPAPKKKKKKLPLTG